MEHLDQSVCRGRKTHNFYLDLLYINKRLENGRLAAQCTICHAMLKNTAIARLRTHRKRCHPDSYVESISETYSYDNIQAEDNKKYIKKPALSPQGRGADEAADEEIVLEIGNTESDYNKLNNYLENVNSQTTIDSKPLENVYSSKENLDQHHSYYSECAVQETHEEAPDIFESKICFETSHLSSLASSSSLSSDTPPSTPNRELYQRQNTTKSSKKKLRSDESYKLNCYVDTLTPKLKEETDMALAKFFFGCNIPFAVVESDHFKKFVKILRPSYVVPCRKTLSTVLLDKVSESMLATNKKYLNKESTLLVDGWKSASNTNGVVTMLRTAGRQSVFLESYDFSTLKETEETLADVCQKSIDLARSRYDCEVYAVVSDDYQSSVTTLWHITCNSHIANLLAKDITNTETVTTVNSILEEFKHTNLENLGGSKIVLPVDARWCSKRDACVSFITNLPIMKKVVAEKKSEITRSLYNDDFIDNVNATIALLNLVSELINECQSTNFSIADAAEAWINLKNKLSEDEYKSSVSNAVKSRCKMATNIYSLAANLLHPVYRGQKLDNEQMSCVQEFLIEILDEKGLNALNMFIKNEDIFGKLFNKKITSVNTFWGLAENKFCSLATLAQKLLKIPASSAQLERGFENSSFFHSNLRNRLTKEKAANLVFVYYSLKLRDSNLSDQY